MLARTAWGFLLAAGAAIGQQGVLSHIAAGGGWTTVITIVNRSQAAVASSVTVHLYGDDGSPLVLPITTTLKGSTVTVTGSSARADLDWNATLLVSIGNQVASTVVGWANVTSDKGGVGGFAIFRFSPPAGPASEGTVPLVTDPPSSLILPFDNTSGFVMGVALANLGLKATTISATVMDDSGKTLGIQFFNMGGNDHTSFVLPTLIPLTAGKRGLVQFVSSSDMGLGGLGLRFSSFGTFTSVPTL